MTNNYQNIEKNGSIVRTTILTVLYFLFLYSFQMPGMPFGTAMLVLVVLAAYMGIMLLTNKEKRYKEKTSKWLWKYILWNVFLFIYVSCLLQFLGNRDGTTPLRDYIYMLIILPVFYISGNFIFRNIEELMKILYIGVIIQSIIILVALFSPTLTIALTLLFPEGAYNSDIMGGFDMAIAEGYRVGLGVFTSAGCLKMAIGQIGACFYLIKSRGSKLYYHFIIYLFITIAVSVIARTGLLISLLGLVLVVVIKRKQNRTQAFKFVILSSILFLTGYFVVTEFFSVKFLDDIFQRFINTAENGIYETYLRGYSGEGGSNKIPPISIETIIGLGITYGVSGSGIETVADGGFMRNYSAMGLIVVLINYMIIAVFFLQRYRSTKSVDYKGIILLMAVILFIGEFKEYYIYYISPMCFMFLIFSLIERSERNYLATNRMPLSKLTA